MTCSCNKDCEHLDKAKSCKQVEADVKICKQVNETNVCKTNQFSDIENKCKNLNECGSNADCRDKEKSVCKEEDGKRTCVNQKFCLSTCSKSEVCDSLHRCLGALPCTSNADCFCNSTCVSYGKTGSKSCQHITEETAKMDDCSTTEDCVKKARNRTVCKEDSGKRICVLPEQCLSQCSDREICNSEQKCVVAHPCRSNNDCRAGEFCWWAQGGKKGQLGPGIGQGRCRTAKESGSTDLILHQCVTNKDCEKTQKVRKVCKEDGKRRSCVHPEECLADCSSKEVCDSKHKCKPISTCKDNSQCNKGEVCLQSQSGQKACQPTFFNPTEQCGSSLDCKTMGGSQSVCKEENGRRICVRPGLCLAACQLNELCDSQHR